MTNMEGILDRLQLLEDEVAFYKVKVVRLERKVEESQGKIRDLEMKEETKATTTMTKTCADSCESCQKEIRDLRREVKILKQEQLDAAGSREEVKKLQILLKSFILKRLKDPQVQQEKQIAKKDDWTDGKEQLSSISMTGGVKTKVKPDEALVVSPHYASLTCHRMEVDHRTGIITRKPVASGQRVSQFISAHPLTARCPFFSLEIIDPGSKTEIGIGVCPDNYPEDCMPGWKSGSIGYHSDNGGIYLERGSAIIEFQTCTVGNVMGCKINVDRKSVSFFRNHVKISELNVRFPISKLHAMVGLRKGKVAVRLLEKEPWRP